MSTWWRDGVLYQLYPRSFQDSNGDGIGDIRGITERLDYLEWLGIAGVWLNPINPSPDKDWGYDVSNFTGVHPELGTLDDLDELISEAARRDIRIILDLVPNHTSDEHEWFRESKSSTGSARRDWYVWADPAPDGGPPNNWLSVFGGESAWERDEASGHYYLHNFLRHQPDLNWWNDDVRRAFDDILRFWFDRGVAGFRIDVAHALIKDAELRDNPAATADDHRGTRFIGQRSEFNMNRPENHEIFKAWRKLSDEYEPARVLVGETFVLDIEGMARYYGTGTDELDLCFNFPFAMSELDAVELSKVVAATEETIPPESWPVWTGSNHDVGRFPTRWCGGNEALTRCTLMLLLTLRGTPFLYYGDEIGMVEPYISKERVVDPVGKRFWPQRGRDGCRTPMQWDRGPGAGFTTPDQDPWLPLGDHPARNVAQQRDDPTSVLTLTHDLIHLRKTTPELQTGAYGSLPSPEGSYAWRRGQNLSVWINLADDPQHIEGLAPGEIAISTDRSRDGEDVAGTLYLGPRQGVIVRH